MERHIVFALGDYYPTPSANGICVDKIIEAFIEAGYSIDVIANNIAGNKKPIKENNKTIYFVELPLINITAERINTENRIIKKSLLLILKKALALRLPILALTYPISSIPRCIKYKKKIKTIIKNNNVVAVIGVHKPIEAIYGSYMAAKESKTPFFGYFLDPLVGGYQKRIVGEHRIYENSKKYENRIVCGSRRTIFMNNHYEVVRKRNKDLLEEKLVFLGPPLLKECVSMNTQQVIREKKRVIYAGSVYKDIRNPQFIMKVFKYVKNAKLDMYVPNPEDWLYQYSNDNITIHKGISHKEMIFQLENADVLLNIGNSTPIFIPSKIIEYISMKKPIISTYRIDEDPCLPYMEKYPASLSLDERSNNIQEAAQKIDNYVMQIQEEISFDKLKESFYINTPEAFVDTIEASITK